MKMLTLNLLPIDLWSKLGYLKNGKHSGIVVILTDGIFDRVKSYESSLEICIKNKIKTYKF